MPQPDSDTILVFYKNDNDYFINGTDFFKLMLAKIIRNTDYSEVIVKDIVLTDSIGVAGSVFSCRHANGRDWWVLQFSENEVLSYLISSKGVKLNNVQPLPFILRRPFLGQSKFSPSGEMFAFQGVFEFNSDTGKGLMIAGFDRCTGTLIDPQLDILPSHDNFLSNGLEFSPDGKLLWLLAKFSGFQV